MRTFMVVTMVLLTFLAKSTQAAQTADARLYCLSVRIDRANAGGPNALYSMEYTGIEFAMNGELFPVFGFSRSHYTFLVMTDNLFDDEFPGAMALNVPTTDSDNDGFPDFFDSSKSFLGSSTGTYDISGYGSGNVNANWSRSSNSTVGNLNLNFQFLGSFNHTFHILEYKGSLSYTPGTNTVSGQMNLAQTEMPGSQLGGPILYTKSTTNPHNELVMQAGSWTNTTAQSFPFISDLLLRDAGRPTNYRGYFEFDDWDLNTFESDYYLWRMSINDFNDADSDGIPDFSDDPQSVVPRRPLLGVARTANDVKLTISGDIGQLCEIQQSSTVNGSNWPTISSVTLTNDPQTVSLPFPPSGTAFWRVRIQ